MVYPPHRKKGVPRKLLHFPQFPETPDEKAFIDRYLLLADKLLTPNLQRETPQDKTEPYNSPATKES